MPDDFEHNETPSQSEGRFAYEFQYNEAFEFQYNEALSWISSLDLRTRQPALCDIRFGDRETDGVFMRMPGGELIPDRYSPTGYLMGPAWGDLSRVAEAGREQGELVGRLFAKGHPVMALATELIGLGINLGQAGRFDWQREGSWLQGYTQYRQFRDVSNVNVGIFAKEAGIPKEVALTIAGLYALVKSSNRRIDQPYFLDERTRVFIELPYDATRKATQSRASQPSDSLRLP